MKYHKFWIVCFVNIFLSWHVVYLCFELSPWLWLSISFPVPFSLICCNKLLHSDVTKCISFHPCLSYIEYKMCYRNFAFKIFFNFFTLKSSDIGYVFAFKYCSGRVDLSVLSVEIPVECFRHLCCVHILNWLHSFLHKVPLRLNCKLNLFNFSIKIKKSMYSGMGRFYVFTVSPWWFNFQKQPLLLLSSNSWWCCADKFINIVWPLIC